MSPGPALRATAPYAGAIAASPVTVAVVLALLLSRRSRTRTRVFLLVWFLALAGLAVVLLSVLPAGSAAGGGAPAAGPGWDVAIGGLLLVLSAGIARRARGSGRPRPLMGRLDRLTPAGTAGVAALFALNPKNLALAAAGAGAAVPAPRPAVLEAVVIGAGFGAIASLPLLAAVGVLAVAGSRVGGLLEGARGWLARHGDATTAAVLAAVGAWMLVRGLAG